MKNNFIRFFALITIVLCVIVVQAKAEKNTELLELSLAELLNLEVSVASITAKPIRGQAGIVSVITRSEIRDSGALFLEDILMQVPGFHTGLDISGVTGMGLRGFWAYLGQIVFIIDGLEITDALYGTFPTGNHIPADQIEKIEIIRGPGSVMYGGNAELAVIKITTRGGDKDVSVNTSLGTSEGEFSQRYGCNAGYKFDGGHLRLGASFGRDYRSDRDYVGWDYEVDEDGQLTTFDMGENSDIDTLLMRVNANYSNFDFNLIYDEYYSKDRTMYGEPLSETYDMNFDWLITSLKYDMKATDKLTIIPKVIYDKQTPWYMKGKSLDEIEIGNYIIETERLTGNLSALYEITENSLIMVGSEYYEEKAEAKDVYEEDNKTFKNFTSDRVTYYSTSVFAQLEVDTSLANITLGGRYQDHNYAGDKFVSRAALTKIWDRFHAKFLYGQSFRTPQTEIITYSYGAPVEPETGTAIEMEMGYVISDTISFVGNLFHMKVEDILVFGILEESIVTPEYRIDEAYTNHDELSTYGAECEFRMIDDWGKILLTYSFYRPDRNTVDSYKTGSSSLTLGFPTHKFTFNTTYHLTDNLSLNATGYYLSKRLAFPVETVGESVKEFDPIFIPNLFVQCYLGKFKVGVGINNLFDEKDDYLSTADDWMPPMPNKSREFFVTASVDI